MIDDELSKLISDMADTMQAAHGVGLAAPQVGVSRMLFLINWNHITEEDAKIKAYINPAILEFLGSRVEMQEGCLSLPEIWADVTRPSKVRVRYETLDGNSVEEVLDGLAARVFQHEYDHLIGILFIDRISPNARLKLKSGLQSILEGKVKPFDGTFDNSKPDHVALTVV